jgi:site-specific DNA-adenine methylase
MSNLFRCASDPKTFSKFIDSKNPPLQEKGKPELSDACHDYFYQCKENLFATDSGIKAMRELLEDRSMPAKKRKALNEMLTHGRAIRQCKNNNKRDDFGDKVKAGRKDQAAAMKYAYVLTSSFSGIDPVDSEFQDYKGKYGSKFKAFYNRLTGDKFIPKLKKIDTCENLSFEEVIAKYDSPTTYFYVDPPYWSTELYYSLHRFGKEQHEELRECLHNIEGKFALSYYDFSELGDMYPKNKFTWETKEFVKPAGATEGIEQSTGEEVLIMNYKP